MELEPGPEVRTCAYLVPTHTLLEPEVRTRAHTLLEEGKRVRQVSYLEASGQVSEPAGVEGAATSTLDISGLS